MLLTYHEITRAHSGYVYSATVSEFEEHLRLIGSLSGFIAAPAITFDDGHVSQFSHAVPVLESEHRKAIFFITAGWSGTRVEYMSWTQLRELVALGHEVQAHGWAHTLLTRCAPKQLTEELRRAKRSLEDGLGIQVNAISMPGGRWNGQVLAACAQEGYRHVYTSDPYSPVKRVDGLTVIGRAMVRRSTGQSELLALLKSEHTALSRERIRFRFKYHLQAVLGDKAYHRVWSWAGNSNQRLQIHEGEQESSE